MRKAVTILLLTVVMGCTAVTGMRLSSPIPPQQHTLDSAGASHGEIEIKVQRTLDKDTVVRFRKGEPCTMLYLLYKIGGLPAHATHGTAAIHRRNPDGTDTEIKVNARELLENAEPTKDIPLKHGDRVAFDERLWAI